MNRTIIAAAALLAGAAIASPLVASAADDEAQVTQAASGQQGMGQMGEQMGGGMHGMMGGMQGMMGDMHDHQGMGMGMMAHRWMHRMMQMSPQQRCEERLARRAGIVAYTVAKLNLTAEQKPAWDKVQSQLQAAGDRERQLCATLKNAGPRSNETVLDRVNRREQFLQAHLQDLQQIKPALEQFYDSLTPDQKAIVDHPFRR
jgi:hypothetical protein